MDYVDLDQVLDQFEAEEENASRKTLPSGDGELDIRLGHGQSSMATSEVWSSVVPSSSLAHNGTIISDAEQCGVGSMVSAQTGYSRISACYSEICNSTDDHVHSAGYVDINSVNSDKVKMCENSSLDEQAHRDSQLCDSCSGMLANGTNAQKNYSPKVEESSHSLVLPNLETVGDLPSFSTVGDGCSLQSVCQTETDFPLKNGVKKKSPLIFKPDALVDSAEPGQLTCRSFITGVNSPLPMTSGGRHLDYCHIGESGSNTRCEEPTGSHSAVMSIVDDHCMPGFTDRECGLQESAGRESGIPVGFQPGIIEEEMSKEDIDVCLKDFQFDMISDGPTDCTDVCNVGPVSVMDCRPMIASDIVDASANDAKDDDVSTHRVDNGYHKNVCKDSQDELKFSGGCNVNQDDKLQNSDLIPDRVDGSDFHREDIYFSTQNVQLSSPLLTGIDGTDDSSGSIKIIDAELSSDGSTTKEARSYNIANLISVDACSKSIDVSPEVICRSSGCQQSSICSGKNPSDFSDKLMSFPLTAKGSPEMVFEPRALLGDGSPLRSPNTSAAVSDATISLFCARVDDSSEPRRVAHCREVCVTSGVDFPASVSSLPVDNRQQKDRSSIKLSRPNSLLGLSKISLDSPFGSRQHEESTHSSQPKVGVDALPDCQKSPTCCHGDDYYSEADCRGAYLPEQDSLIAGFSARVAAESERADPTAIGQDGVSHSGQGGFVCRMDPSPPPDDGSLNISDNRLEASMSSESPSEEMFAGDFLSPSPVDLPGKRFDMKCDALDKSGAGGSGGPFSQCVVPGDVRWSERSTGAPPTADFTLGAGELSRLHVRQSGVDKDVGTVVPVWLPDSETASCMLCSAPFTFRRRRHHCRACGRVFCSKCCGSKSRLPYLDGKLGRVCLACFAALEPATDASSMVSPTNHEECCSGTPVCRQEVEVDPHSTSLPSGSMLRQQGTCKKSDQKQVMFSDGIRPGGDLTELDGSDQLQALPRQIGRPQKTVDNHGGGASLASIQHKDFAGLRNPCLIPDGRLPPLALWKSGNGEPRLVDSSDVASVMAQITDDSADPVCFAINLDLFVFVKIVSLDCCVNRTVWCFSTRGMAVVGQDELVILLETLPEEQTVPRDVFCHFNAIFLDAGNGNTIGHLSHTVFTDQFLGSTDHRGMLYLRASFQCTKKLILPQTSCLFGIVLQKWEIPWAKVFPIRLMLRLGSEFRYYPCPLVSVRHRRPVFFEIGHTIMNLLADFTHFQYMLPQVNGATVHMSDQMTSVNLPRNRYTEVMSVISGSNEHVMAFGVSFSRLADSHLVCVQKDDGSYQTQAISIQDKPRKVTGASFAIFNGALKHSSGLTAKCSIVEDGVMVQVLPKTMAAIKQSLKDMTDMTIPCGYSTGSDPQSCVCVCWVDDDRKVNVGVSSTVDGKPLDCVRSVTVHNSTDYVGGEGLAVRWTEVFFLRNDADTHCLEPVDLSQVSESLAGAMCVALTPHLKTLREEGLCRIGLRVTLHPDTAGYEVGSRGHVLSGFYVNDLDNALIPIIHGVQIPKGCVVLELVFHVVH